MWKCKKCGEQVENAFDVCWKCGTTKEGVEDPQFGVDVEQAKTPDSVGVGDPFGLDHVFARLLICALWIVAIITGYWAVKHIEPLPKAIAVALPSVAVLLALAEILRLCLRIDRHTQRSNERTGSRQRSK